MNDGNNKNNIISQDMWNVIAKGLRTSGDQLPPFFVIDGTQQQQEQQFVVLNKETSVKNQNTNDEQVIFGFLDPTQTTDDNSSQPVMGWPMRHLVAYLVLHLGLGGKTVRILSLRPVGGFLSGRRKEDDDMSPADVEATSKHSILLQVTLPKAQDYDYNNEGVAGDDPMRSTGDTPFYKVVGWELNTRQKPGPRSVNLRPLLDQDHLAVQASDLNLKLMKWRMIPDLNVELLQSTKVLLIGAGTLGCSVARTLLGWGIRQFKFVDYGTVSYSNPVRQNLFTLDDCHFNHGQGRPKAQAAADALKLIAADVSAEGYTLSIPMPGHAYVICYVVSSIVSLFFFFSL
jgi:ubiquitin-like modifier-activating enzyme ATG7